MAANGAAPAESLAHTLGPDTALAAAQAGAIDLAVTLYAHRELTHQSLSLRPALRWFSRVALWATGTKPRIWADVHRTHHSLPDANLGPILETADFLEWVTANPDRVPAEAIPELFPAGTLDPGADLSLDEVLAIGDVTRELVRDRYDVPDGYSGPEIARLLDRTKPRYFYDDKIGLFGRWLRRNQPQQEPPERSLQRLFPELRDPHSPPLHRHGILGILHENVFRYQELARYHEENHGPDNTPLGQPDKWDRRLFERPGLGIAALFAGNIGLKLAMSKDRRSPSGVLRAAARGSLVTFLAINASVWGGKITNAGGHAGQSIARGLLTGRPELKPDGTYTSNAPLLSPVTFDEVGGQEPHHAWPWMRAYTGQTGWRGFAQAPFGSVVDWLAKRRILMEPGPQFDHPEVEQRPALTFESLTTDGDYIRPDEPALPVLMLEAARRRTYADRQAALMD